MKRTGRRSAIGRVVTVVRQHFADPTFYARRYRASREGGPRTTSSAEPAGAGTSEVTAQFRARLRAILRWLAASHASPPSAFDLWIARPAVFTPAFLIGSIAAAATFDTTRTASMSQTLIPVGSVIVVWAGLVGAMSHAERRWPRVGRALLGVWGLTSFAMAVAGIVFAGRAISQPLIQLGLWSMISAVAALLTNPPADGGA